MRGIIVLLVTFGSTAGGLQCAGPGEPVQFADSFELGLDEWSTGFDLPDDPNNPGHKVAFSIEQSGAQASDGSFSAEYYLDGRQDDGTIWLTRAVDLTPGTACTVSLSFDLWSEAESFNTLAMVAAYAGDVPADLEADFDVSRPANLVAGWRAYDYNFDVTTSQAGQVYVALGISAVWETEMTYYIDDATVDIIPK